MKLTEFQRVRLAKKRFKKRYARKGVAELNKPELHEILRMEQVRELRDLRAELGGEITYTSIIAHLLPRNTRYLLSCPESEFSWRRLKSLVPWKEKIFRVPEVFSLIDAPEESYEFLQQVIYALLIGKKLSLEFDYEHCTQLDIGAQVLLDVIIKDVIVLYERCNRRRLLSETVGVLKRIGLTNIIKTRRVNEPVLKLLYSVGSPAIHSNHHINFLDLEPYRLSVYSPDEDDLGVDYDQRDAIETTELIEYVRRCLRRVGKDLPLEEEKQLYSTISEILINASEHSTVGTRFSIGYFRDEGIDGKHMGEFRLVIMNFGRSIYQKFKDPECPNKENVKRMEKLSVEYTTKRWFKPREFQEETLWTLYALQEGVTSTAPDKFLGRGNGSIQFIKSFLYLNGSETPCARNSRMNILSGQTWIKFDGTHGIITRHTPEGSFDFMMFNDTGDVRDKPDPNFVKDVANYFPGTVISATIWLDEVTLRDVSN